MITKRELLTIQDHAPLLSVVEQQLVSSHLEAIEQLQAVEQTLASLSKAVRLLIDGDAVGAATQIYVTPGVQKYLTI
ncbi:hypothetical protein SEA_IPHANE7_132 [Mycobacterium phage IPhane7]|uniref:Uncharacterized protein n=3 Tax=Bongovirus bongo TaxID=1983750 RepID=A0A0M4R2J8_9CAUD|nr:hypothetical protein SEA_BRICOLE_136 [Mycobacterium phage Bricole]AXQ52754.1 hypothetical protein SEA_IPHANE7_132 [Mycobacterium phage IPhane7]QGJ93257.1 hypothetical protein SEA_TYDAWG_129 [Mycobacterium phage TyDawg]WNM75326.1 hypothetical protein SEA_AUSPICE_134 [Mycobacterium phage Auspice]